MAKSVRASKQADIAKFTSVSELLLNTPPYTQLDATGPECEAAITDLVCGTRFDGHCPACGKSTTITLQSAVPRQGYSKPLMDALAGGIPLSRFTASCARDPLHVFVFFVGMGDFKIQKFGQLPSLADLAIDESKKYRSVLSKEDSRELHKAIGLAAHSVGIGSFVYLRRIFERLIWQRFNSAKAANGWSDSDFQQLRMDEKVRFLKDHLPEFLVENSVIYGLISKGLHELTEEECLEMFPVLKGSIVEILEQDQERKKAKQRQDEMKAKIQAYSSKVGSGGSEKGS